MIYDPNFYHHSSTTGNLASPPAGHVGHVTFADGTKADPNNGLQVERHQFLVLLSQFLGCLRNLYLSLCLFLYLSCDTDYHKDKSHMQNYNLTLNLSSSNSGIFIGRFVKAKLLRFVLHSLIQSITHSFSPSGM